MDFLMYYDSKSRNCNVCALLAECTYNIRDISSEERYEIEQED